jgi:hypothetical protein
MLVTGNSQLWIPCRAFCSPTISVDREARFTSTDFEFNISRILVKKGCLNQVRLVGDLEICDCGGKQCPTF